MTRLKGVDVQCLPCIIVSIFFCLSSVQSADLEIGLLLDSKDKATGLAQAANAAATAINSDGSLLNGITLKIKQKFVTGSDAVFGNFQNACDSVSKGYPIIINAVRATSSVRATQPVSEAAQVSQIAVFETDPILSSLPYLVQMTPNDILEDKALFELIKHYKWASMAIMTDSNRKSELYNLRLKASQNSWALKVIEPFSITTPVSKVNFAPRLQTIKDSGIRIVILNTRSADYAKAVLEKAKEMKMIADGWAWILTSATTVNMPSGPACDPTASYLIGSLGIQPSYGLGGRAAEFETKWADIVKANDKFKCEVNKQVAGQIYDSVYAAAYGLDNYFKNTSTNTLTPTVYSKSVCEDRNFDPQSFGKKLNEQLLLASGSGANQNISFMPNGDPKMKSFDILNYNSVGWNKIGVFDTELKITETAVFPGLTNTVPLDIPTDLDGIKFKIVSKMVKPLLMWANTTPETYDPKTPYKGYQIDLIDALKAQLGFDYEINIVKDGKYGVRSLETGKWDGMIGEVLRGENDFILADIIISSKREEAIRFTKPWMDLGLTILTTVDDTGENLLNFMETFTPEVWFIYLGCIIFTVFAVWFCAMFSPYGYHGRYAQRHDIDDETYADESESLNFYNSLHFAFSSWGGLNVEAIPRCFSGRTVGNTLWLCGFFIACVYTAYLAAFLTVAKLETGVSNAEQLAGQKLIRYGTLKDSAIEEFFEEQVINPFRAMNDFMKKYNTHVETEADGIQKVKDSAKITKGNPGRYAFIYDSTTLSYEASMDCNLRVVGDPFRKGGYGIGFTKTSPFFETFNKAVVRLRGSSFPETAWKKWYTSGPCDGSLTMPATSAMTFWKMRGIYLLFACGLAVSIIVFILEWFIAAHREVKRYGNSEGSPRTMGEALKQRGHRAACDVRWCLSQRWQKINRPSNGTFKCNNLELHCGSQYKKNDEKPKVTFNNNKEKA